MAQEYYYITSKLSDGTELVLDLKDGSTTSGTQVVSNERKANVDSQLWTKVPTTTEGRATTYFIENKLTGSNGETLVLDVTGNNNAPGTPIISYGKKSGASPNQTWKLFSSNNYSGYFFITSQLDSGGNEPNVIAIEGPSVTPGTNVISNPKNTTNPKKCAFAPSEGQKKQAFAEGECKAQLWAFVPPPIKKKGAFAPNKQAFADDDK